MGIQPNPSGKLKGREADEKEEKKGEIRGKEGKLKEGKKTKKKEQRKDKIERG